MQNHFPCPEATVHDLTDCSSPFPRAVLVLQELRWQVNVLASVQNCSPGQPTTTQQAPQNKALATVAQSDYF
jgi:hypothetical protein